jgi:hypothetical protein
VGRLLLYVNIKSRASVLSPLSRLAPPLPAFVASRLGAGAARDGGSPRARVSADYLAKYVAKYVYAGSVVGSVAGPSPRARVPAGVDYLAKYVAKDVYAGNAVGSVAEPSEWRP